MARPHTGPGRLEIGAHVPEAPPFMLLKEPASVDAYTLYGLDGSMASEVTGDVPVKTWVHVCPPSVVLRMFPPRRPANATPWTSGSAVSATGATATRRVQLKPPSCLVNSAPTPLPMTDLNKPA